MCTLGKNFVKGTFFTKDLTIKLISRNTCSTRENVLQFLSFHEFRDLGFWGKYNFQWLRWKRISIWNGLYALHTFVQTFQNGLWSLKWYNTNWLKNFKGIVIKKSYLILWGHVSKSLPNTSRLILHQDLKVHLSWMRAKKVW